MQHVKFSAGLGQATKHDEIRMELALLRDAFGEGYEEQLQDRLLYLVRSEWRTVSDLIGTGDDAHFVVSRRNA